MLAALARNWWVFLVKGLCAILFGALTFAWPGITLWVLMLFFAAYCIMDGMLALVASRARHDSGRAWGQMLLVGIVSILAGIAAFAWPGLTALALLYLIAAWAIVRGISEIVAAIELRKSVQNEWVLILSGVLAVLFGIVLFVNPGAGALAMLMVIGVFAILRGVLLIGLSLRLRGMARHAAAA